MPQETPQAVVVVGVEVGQAPAILQQAAVFAARFDARLLCAYADRSATMMAASAYGPIFAVEPDPPAPVFPPELREQIAAILPADLDWDTALLDGPPADALASLADTHDAALIVVGTRQATMRGAVGEFFNGSVAVQLTHRQHRPVLVIPADPTPAGHPLPWDDPTTPTGPAD